MQSWRRARRGDDAAVSDYAAGVSIRTSSRRSSRTALAGGDVACLQLRLKDVADDVVRRADRGIAADRAGARRRLHHERPARPRRRARLRRRPCRRGGHALCRGAAAVGSRPHRRRDLRREPRPRDHRRRGRRRLRRLRRLFPEPDQRAAPNTAPTPKCCATGARRRSSRAARSAASPRRIAGRWSKPAPIFSPSSPRSGPIPRAPALPSPISTRCSRNTGGRIRWLSCAAGGPSFDQAVLRPHRINRISRGRRRGNLCRGHPGGDAVDEFRTIAVASGLCGNLAAMASSNGGRQRGISGRPYKYDRRASGGCRPAWC